ncbi:MAG: TRAP transporter small permease [Rubrivivax sp.]|nr:MAG: TRAP transporter small permease [Rubrivivax sp.]
MKTWTDRALLGLHVAGAAVLAFLTLVICYDVAGRLLFNRPFAGTAELASVGLVLLTFMQAPYVIRERKLLRVTFFLGTGPARPHGRQGRRPTPRIGTRKCLSKCGAA